MQGCRPGPPSLLLPRGGQGAGSTPREGCAVSRAHGARGARAGSLHPAALGSGAGKGSPRRRPSTAQTDQGSSDLQGACVLCPTPRKPPPSPPPRCNLQRARSPLLGAPQGPFSASLLSSRLRSLYQHSCSMLQAGQPVTFGAQTTEAMLGSFWTSHCYTSLSPFLPSRASLERELGPLKRGRDPASSLTTPN